MTEEEEERKKKEEEEKKEKEEKGKNEEIEIADKEKSESKKDEFKTTPRTQTPLEIGNRSKKVDVLKSDEITELKKDESVPEKEENKKKKKETDDSETFLTTRIMIAVKDPPRKHKREIISKTSYQAWCWILEKFIRSNRHYLEFELIFININPKEGGEIPEDIIFRELEDFQLAEKNGQTNGIDLLKYMISWTTNFGISCTGYVREGSRHEVICKEVKKHKPDLLVVEGRHPHSIHRLLFTDISEYCLDHVKCPVLVFPVVVEEEREEDMEDLKAVEAPNPEPTEE